MDSLFAEHETFMRATHSFGEGPEPCISEYYVCKGEEMADDKPTGSLLYILVEEYVTDKGLPAHMEAGKTKFGKFDVLMEKMGKYACSAEMTGSVITCGSDTPSSVHTTKGQVGIHFVVAVDPSEEAAFDALWARHETWMRSTHSNTAGAGDDSKAPRYTHFSINKGKEVVDDKETGKICYSMTETYVAPEGIAGHFASAEVNWKDDLGTLTGTYLPKAKFADIGHTKVIASFK